MRRIMWIAAMGAALTLGGVAYAVPLSIGFTEVYFGGLSYDAGGANVVTPGTAFYEAVNTNDFLGFQLIGGDGIDNPVVGNFAIYAELAYSDPDGTLAWAMANPDQEYSLEMRLYWLGTLMTGMYGAGDPVANPVFTGLTLDANDIPASDLVASFGEIDEWGYTELATNIWVDFAFDEANYPGLMAISVVMQDYPFPAEIASVNGYFNASLNSPILLDSQRSGVVGAPVPEPVSIVMLGMLGAGMFGARKLRRLRK